MLNNDDSIQIEKAHLKKSDKFKKKIEKLDKLLLSDDDDENECDTDNE